MRYAPGPEVPARAPETRLPASGSAREAEGKGFAAQKRSAHQPWPEATAQLNQPSAGASSHNQVVVYIDNTLSEIRYRIPPDAQWAVWDDVNCALAFMTDEDVMENYRQNLRLAEEMGDASEILRRMLDEGMDPAQTITPEQAWQVIDWIWEGDPGGRGWQARIPRGATRLALRDDEDDRGRGDGPQPTFGFGEPPVGEGAWEEAGY